MIFANIDTVTCTSYTVPICISYIRLGASLTLRVSFFLGYFASQRIRVTTMVIAKLDPDEKFAYRKTI